MPLPSSEFHLPCWSTHFSWHQELWWSLDPTHPRSLSFLMTSSRSLRSGWCFLKSYLIEPLSCPVLGYSSLCLSPKFSYSQGSFHFFLFSPPFPFVLLFPKALALGHVFTRCSCWVTSSCLSTRPDFAPSAWAASLQLSAILAIPVGSPQVTQHFQNGASFIFDNTTNILDIPDPVISEDYQY